MVHYSLHPVRAAACADDRGIGVKEYRREKMVERSEQGDVVPSL